MSFDTILSRTLRASAAPDLSSAEKDWIAQTAANSALRFIPRGAGRTSLALAACLVVAAGVAVWPRGASTLDETTADLFVAAAAGSVDVSQNDGTAPLASLD